MSKKPSLDLIEGACLVLISNGKSHGYQLAKQFEVETVLGEVLTLSRPVVYRAIKSLEAHALIRSVESTGVRGQLKWQLKCTVDGEKLAKQWLSEPVTHLRDIREKTNSNQRPQPTASNCRQSQAWRHPLYRLSFARTQPNNDLNNYARGRARPSARPQFSSCGPFQSHRSNDRSISCRVWLKAN
ncbi:MAG: PadR family transcriptional regulator [Actinobacteria bacterium]|nr:PadR family transcriptional regulator [Actinomycetota bacterium]